jgi:hypothetical protein
VHKIESLLEMIYERNTLNGNYIIEVALTNFAEIFNDWDHSPYKRKDINPELLTFLEDSMDDIPMKYDVDIGFYLTEETQNKAREEVIASWVKTFYSFYIEIEKSKIRSIINNATIYIFISIALFAFSYFGDLQGNTVINYTLTQIIVVGGWVFMWEAISRLLFNTKVISKLIKNYERLSKAKISFRYSKPSV